MTGPFLATYEGQGFWMPQQASDHAVNVDALFSFILWLSVFFFVLLMGLTVYFAVKYRKKSETQRSSPLAHSFKLEFLWSAIPTVLLVVIFAWGFRDYQALSATPPDALELRVTGQKWNWTVAYPKLDRECTSEMQPDGRADVDFYVPVNQPFTVRMSSSDVLHSFWIPAFRVKRDVLPNRYTGFTVTPTVPGSYEVNCTEYCGDNHSVMRGKVHVLDEKQWEEFLSKDDERCKLDPSAPDYKPKLFAKYGCASCHGVKADQGVIVGPNLHGVFGRTEQTNKGPVQVDENYIRESIEYPEKVIVDGFAGKNMPSYRGRISEDELSALIDYLKSLKD
jgi:cytochrome c oxidase subunit 2